MQTSDKRGRHGLTQTIEEVSVNMKLIGGKLLVKLYQQINPSQPHLPPNSMVLRSETALYNDKGAHRGSLYVKNQETLKLQYMYIQLETFFET